MPTTRRKFLNDASKTIAATALAPLITPSLLAYADNRSFSPNEKIKVALIGARGMGFGDLQNAIKQPGVECIGICDVDSEVLNRRIADVQKIQGTAPVGYKDFRKLMENKDIDAVIIGTPDHWHCLPFIAACEAGKDIYVEKPLANSIAECDLMVKATRKYQRVVQVGQQQRSGAHWQEAMSYMQAGKIGQLRKVNIWSNFNYPIGAKIVPDGTPPSTVDFDFWLGPAAERSFNANRFHGAWRMFWDYGGGLMTDWGVHLIDMAMWVKGIKEAPLATMASGGNFAYPDHAHETFDTMSVSYQLKDYTINWDHTAGSQKGPYGRSYGLAFIGNDATLVINRESWEVIPEYNEETKADKVPAVASKPGGESHELHMKNFLECIKTRKDPACPIEAGRLVALYAHSANISLRTNSRLEWNETAKNFGKNEAANRLITPKYRKPWVLPKV